MRLKLFMIEVTKCPLALIFGKNASSRSFDLVLVIHVVQNRHGWRETDTLVLLLTWRHYLYIKCLLRVEL